MSLLEKLAERSQFCELEKNAEDIFARSVIDELQKLGYNIDLEKNAALIPALKGVGKKALKFLGIGAKKGTTAAKAATKAKPGELFKRMQKMNVDYGKIKGPAGKGGVGF